ncbi:MAG: hypothetical protein FWH19_00535 [Treponema sp.]|nr:hypothetical protein [Treponema sp.]
MTGYFRFRSVDEWKSALMILPESGFFELLRSVFGNIKTPFNKQRLLDDLFNLLTRDEIRKTIAAYIDEQDHKLIAALALLNEPSSKELADFFSGELSPAEVHALAVNLEERLIVYRFKDEQTMRLTLNPVLEQVLAPYIADSRLLFPSFEKASFDKLSNARQAGFDKLSNAKQASSASTERRASVRIKDARTLAALFVFVLAEKEFFKAGEGIRKKILDEGKKFFPGLAFELAVRVLLSLELFRVEGRELLPNTGRIEDFKALPFSDCQEYWAAGLFHCLYEVESHNEPNMVDSAILGWGRINAIAALIHRIMGSFLPGEHYPETTVIRQLELLAREDRISGSAWNSPLLTDRNGRHRPQLPFQHLLAVLEQSGLLHNREDHWTVPAPLQGENGDSKEPKPFIVMDTALSFIIYPEISLADAMALGAFCSLKDPTGEPELGAVFFELSRKSVVRGFDSGISSGQMLALLERLSGGRLDANLGWTLSDWEKRYAGVSLSQGLVLSLEEELRYLAKAKPVSSLIQRTLAPGVYLLSTADRSEAAAALRKAGVDIIAQPPPAGGESERSRFSKRSFPRLGSARLSSPPRAQKADKAQEKATASLESKDSIQENLRRALEKMTLTKQERDELLARIERRLILSEAQLEKTHLRYEKLEARGLDYQGKLSITKQAIETGSLLDLSWPLPKGELSRMVGMPQALEKKEGDSILVLENTKDAANIIRIPLRKISHLRRIKQSIFGE